MAAKKTTETGGSSANAKTGAKKPSATSKPAEARKTSVTLEQLKREIEVRAHEIYEERVGAGRSGDDLSDWLAAEAEIKKRYKLK